MLKRILPVLLLRDGELVKSVRFGDHRYIGDIVNAVKIYNEMEVDEVLVFGIGSERQQPDFGLLREVATECFVPLSYGGGLRDIPTIDQLIQTGIEKAVLNEAAYDYDFVARAVREFGSSTLSACIDYRVQNGRRMACGVGRGEAVALKDHLQQLVALNVGEIILQHLDGDGTYAGYDLATLKELRKDVPNPLVLCGGCRDLADIADALNSGADAVAAGSLFVYYTQAKGILVNYPSAEEMAESGIQR